MSATVVEVAKGSKTDLTDDRYTVRLDLDSPAGAVDVSAVLVTADGTVRSDADFVFFNNPAAAGVRLESDAVVAVDLSALPEEIHRVVIAGSTEAQGIRFGEVAGLRVSVNGSGQALSFAPTDLDSETVLQAVALYRRGSGWRLDAIGQGYSAGLAAFATEHGITVDEEEPEIAATVVAPQAGAPQQNSAIDLRKVDVVLTKDSPDKRATIDLRKGDPGYVLTVGLEWDGRGATYDGTGTATTFGTGDLDVYFFCRNELTGDYVVVSGEKGHQGDLNTWPYIHHQGDSRGPGAGGLPATEQVVVRPTENGDLLLNVYQSVDNGAGAIDTFGRPRVRVRYGRPGPDGAPGPDADQITVLIGNGKNSFWATVAHIDVRDGILTVDGTIRYSRAFSERMPVLDTEGTWVRSAKNGPVGRSKGANGLGLTRYEGQCPAPR
ncbi:TerD family protein [Nocardia caishijiensis]|uniref:Stress response protein SCP2 n=1 Tax=Nocardia caishijiensis TaxID=184756 RepID=A0ABQ6YM42_9NOCA|nr:TerD family protein [Nocardia caishijiensis]KAF0846786.1 stress response protein SCP2 [Nocardia caishijiensis]